VGGVVGGLAVLGVAVIGIVFILLKRRKQKNGGNKGEYVPPADQQQPGAPAYQPYYAPEKPGNPSQPGYIPTGSPQPQMGQHGYMPPPGQPYPPQMQDPRYSGYAEMPANAVQQHSAELDSSAITPQPNAGHDGKPRVELGS
jgi:hypothetical protein